MNKINFFKYKNNNCKNKLKMIKFKKINNNKMLKLNLKSSKKFKLKNQMKVICFYKKNKYIYL